MTLEEKFKAFVLSKKGSECIDDLPSGTMMHRRADYLLYDRGIIAEVKYLIDDRGKLINDRLNELANSDPNFPQFFGTVHVEEVIRRHPEGKKFRNWLCNYAARNLDALLRSANHQINETRISLKLERSVGLLILLNEKVQLYDEDFVYQEASRLLHKKNSKGEYERSHIDAVWFINEIDAKKRNVSSSFFVGPSARNDQINTLLNMLHIRWAAHNNYAISIDQKSFSR